MCNRYGYAHDYEKLRDEFSQIKPLRWTDGLVPNLPSGDVTIGDTAAVVRIENEAAVASALKWAWRNRDPYARAVFNFRSEGRDFSESDRVLIPANCFYEFSNDKHPKTRWTFTLAGADLLMIAGIVRRGAFTMLTTAPGPDMAPYHNRQIVVLPDKHAWAAWGVDAILPGPLPAGALTVAQA